MENINTEALVSEIHKELVSTDLVLKNPFYPDGRPMSDTEVSIIFGYNQALRYLSSFMYITRTK